MVTLGPVGSVSTDFSIQNRKKKILILVIGIFWLRKAYSTIPVNIFEKFVKNNSGTKWVKYENPFSILYLNRTSFDGRMMRTCRNQTKHFISC